LDATLLKVNDLHQREISLIGTVSQRLEDFVQAAGLIAQNPNLLDPFAVLTVPSCEPQHAFEKSLDPAINRVLVIFDR
jgi:hypothetical protein